MYAEMYCERVPLPALGSGRIEEAFLQPAVVSFTASEHLAYLWSGVFPGSASQGAWCLRARAAAATRHLLLLPDAAAAAAASTLLVRSSMLQFNKIAIEDRTRHFAVAPILVTPPPNRPVCLSVALSIAPPLPSLPPIKHCGTVGIKRSATAASEFHYHG